MWNYTQDDWLKEVRRSLKQEVDPVFKKSINSERTISPFSRIEENSYFQKNSTSDAGFLTIQNYSDLKKSKMDEWMAEKSLGLRFRQLPDLREMISDSSAQGKAVFISQPFPFLFDEDTKRIAQSASQFAGKVNLGWSPLSFGLTRGEILKRPFLDWEKIFNQEEIHTQNISWFYLSSAPYQWAGAEPHMELAVMLALAYDILKELDATKIPIERPHERISFGLAVGTDIIVESAKITAMKVLWQRLMELVSDSSSVDVEVYALPSVRSFAGRDPWNNIMRLTLMSFSALAGGAAGFKCIPYDVLNRQKSPDAIRVSTNIPLILKKEGFLDLVKNPFDGNSLFDETVKGLCESAWTYFQEIERKGGVFEAVRSGWLQSEIKRECEVAKNDLNYREKEMVGINKFIARDPQYGNGTSQIIKLNEIIDPMFLKKSDDDYLSVEPLLVSALGYEWEKLQCQGDKYQSLHGQRPSVPVIKGGGPIVEKKSQALQSLLHLGGLDPQWVAMEKIADLDNHLPLVIVLPGHEEAEDQMVSALKAKGIEKVWSGGSVRVGTGVERYIQPQFNSLEFLEDIYRLTVGLL